MHKKLYHHRTDGGAEYLTDRWTRNPDGSGSKEGVCKNAKIIIRIDGDITKDAEITLADELFTHNDSLSIPGGEPGYATSDRSAYFDQVWRDVHMPKDYTCGCGLYVHSSRKNQQAVHSEDCFYHEHNAPDQARLQPSPEAGCSAPLAAQLPRDVSELYYELLYAVARKFPGESRHETALRYIRDTEERVCEAGSCKQNIRAETSRPQGGPDA